MKQSTIDKYANILEESKKYKSLKAYCKAKGISYKSVTNVLCEMKKLTAEKKDGADRTETVYMRDDEGHIQYYGYKIYRRDKAPLCGRLTRDEMQTIHRLYSYYGDSLTQRVISRHFTELSLMDFKRILRAFNITKASAPFAPHMIEEHSEEELREIQLREKENSFLRKAEEDQIRNNEKLLKKYAQENMDLRNQLNSRNSIIRDLIGEDIAVQDMDEPEKDPSKPDVVVFLSDLHVGAYNEKYGYVPLPGYDEEEIMRRLGKVASYLRSGEYNSVTVCNLGDSMDSFNRQTTRGGHELPSVISNKEQSAMYLNVMMNFFGRIKDMNARYLCIGEANHDGDWGWINNMVLAERLKQSFGIQSYISPNPIDSFDVNGVSVIYLHGKDIKNQFKGFPLVLDFKTESWFNAYFIDAGKEFRKRKCVVKGDLHQFAYTRAKHFDYISAPSLYGSSTWITANFGRTPWGVLALEIDGRNSVKTVLIDDDTD